MEGIHAFTKTAAIPAKQPDSSFRRYSCAEPEAPPAQIKQGILKLNMFAYTDPHVY